MTVEICVRAFTSSSLDKKFNKLKQTLIDNGYKLITSKKNKALCYHIITAIFREED